MFFITCTFKYEKRWTTFRNTGFSPKVTLKALKPSQRIVVIIYAAGISNRLVKSCLFGITIAEIIWWDIVESCIYVITTQCPMLVKLSLSSSCWSSWLWTIERGRLDLRNYILFRSNIYKNIYSNYLVFYGLPKRIGYTSKLCRLQNGCRTHVLNQRQII